ncbi:hypothetical protein F53441_12096 [Fusarium austroafricanum]|uniref:Uncharacterized protein n=1 Tax=Fusarium austroafricanum TaxID=2364996 RepID=A0A8H4JY99_9HYPO|nr:hypothetical protein F53441_12096 [Fusarium austroafricanum]
MNGGGYQNSGSISDAKELREMFNKTGKEKDFGSKAKRKATGSSIPTKRAAFQLPQRPPPPAPSSHNVPRPSQRNYTETLLTDPLKRAPGALLGKSTLDFLSRNDTATKQPLGLIQEQNGDIVTMHPPTTLTTPESATKPIQGQKKPIAKLLPAMSPVPEQHSDPIQGQKEKVVVKLLPKASPVPKTPSPLANSLEFLRGSTIDSDQSAINTSTTLTVGEPKMSAQGPVTPVKKTEKTKKSIVETYFAMMDSDDESEEDLIAFEDNDVAPNKSNVSIFLRYSSDELLKLRPNAKNDILPPDCIVKRGKNSGRKAIVAGAGKLSSHLACSQEDAIGGSSSSKTGQPRSTQAVPRASPQIRTTAPVESKPEVVVTQPTITKSYVQQIPPEPKPKASVAQQTSFKVNKPGIAQAMIEAKTAEFQKAEEAFVPDEIRGEPATSKRLRPQAPAFIPGSPGASLSSRAAIRKPTKGLSASLWAK